MLQRIFIGAFILIAALALYKVYGYRYVLEHVRDNSSVNSMMGSPSAPINIIAYIDYDSSWSRRVHPVLLQLIARNPDVSVIIKPLPGVSEESELAARIALAAQDSKNFLSIHNVLMESREEMNETNIAQLVRLAGMNYANLREVAFSDKITQQINAMKREALFLSVTSTPYLFIEKKSMQANGLTMLALEDIVQDFRMGRRY